MSSQSPHSSGADKRQAKRRGRTLLKVVDEHAAAEIAPALQEVIEYRKSGLSLNHVVGCPLDCAYCVRHLFGNFAMRHPVALRTDEDAVRELLQHRYFVPDRTPLQLFNRATDPLLAEVKPHTFRVLQLLDAQGLRNRVLIISRYHITAEDCRRLNVFSTLRVTLLFTHSGIADPRMEPVRSSIAARSLMRAYKHADNYRVVLYWRPLVPGLNDTTEHIRVAAQLSQHAHATVFTGLFYRDEIRAYYQTQGLPEPHEDVARRKILPKQTEARILAEFAGHGGRNLFRKTSCAVSFARGEPDYNGHFGVRELCDICPQAQLQRCQQAHQPPSPARIAEAARGLGEMRLVHVDGRAAIIDGFSEQQRYFLQHRFAFQFHDVAHPHRMGQHGRAPIGWGNGD